MTDRTGEQALFQTLLAPYDLRDGHNPDQPFASPPCIGRGWYGLVKTLIEDLIRLGWDRGVLQIKEKYGTLRFYVTQREDRLLERIESAMELSARVCEECGGDGAWLDENGAMSTLCDACRGRMPASPGET